MFGFFGKKTDGFSVKWYRRLAEQGDATAQCTLGEIYITGQGVLKDHKEAIDWKRVFIFFSDERSVPPTDSDSNYHMALENGFSFCFLEKSSLDEIFLHLS